MQQPASERTATASLPVGDVDVEEDVEDIEEDIALPELSGLGGEIKEMLPEDVTAPRAIPELIQGTVDGTDPSLLLPEDDGEPSLPGIQGQAARLIAQPSLAEVPAQVVLEGRIEAVPLLDVLRLLQAGRHSGVLKAWDQAGSLRGEVYFQRGLIAQARGEGAPELRLGRFLMAEGQVASAQIERVAQERGQRLGQRLMAHGALELRELRELLARQSAEWVYTLLTLRQGRFRFERMPALPREVQEEMLGGGLGLDVDALLLQGYRRMEEWHQLEQDQVEGAVYLRLEERRGQAERLGLTAKESQVLGLCTGRLGVREIARDARLSPLETTRILRRLQAVQLVRRRVPPLAV